ncbi:MAG: ADP-glyceromanno-heptose 6-epimerase [Bacteroidetes bacterium]|nr:ADP-glyceromanno-heptose 6-epimerase [Bacteroidota bacterium]
MFVVTGAAGFIGSCLVSRLNHLGFTDLILVDDFSNTQKNRNLVGKKYLQKIDRSNFFSWLELERPELEFIYHLGARTDTTEINHEIFDQLNVAFSKKVWTFCTSNSVPLVYASSAATYGLGEFGYDDKHEIIPKLLPLNPYGDSKNDFDKWVLTQTTEPPFWSGLKFFNVYGPNEYHKGRMASVIFHAFNQIQQKGNMQLFRSHNPNFKDGEQLRDFIYVKDLIDVCLFLKNKRPASGIYNLGSGKARSFLDLVSITFQNLKKPVAIDFIDTPEDIRERYQYFTEANMAKLRAVGYSNEFTSIEEGVKDYVTNYLTNHRYL